MKIIDIPTIPSTKGVGGVRFGSVIQLVKRPNSWEDYISWEPSDKFLLTSDYYKGPKSKTDADGRYQQLAIVALDNGAVYGLSSGAKVIERPELGLMKVSTTK